MKRVYVYTRVSTNEQVTGGGFARQLEACRNFCASKGWTVLREFREQESGSVEAMRRPELSAAIELCNPGYEVDTIVVERADRIARDLIVSELFFKTCRDKKIFVYAVDTGEELVNAEADPTRTLIRQVLGALSEWVKAEIARKLLDGRRRMKEKTGMPCGGKPVFGTQPGQAKWVWRILWAHRQGRRIGEIRDFLNYDPRWRHAQPRRFWHSSQVSHLIKFWEYRPEFSQENFTKLLENHEAALEVFPLTRQPNGQPYSDV